MKKIALIFSFLLIPLFSFSCDQTKSGTISLSKTNVTLVEGEEAIVRYSTTNSQLCNYSNSDSTVIECTNSVYSRYNSYIWFSGLKPGKSTITVTANKCPSVTLEITVKKDDNPCVLDSTYTIAEAAPIIDEAIVDNYKTVRISPIEGIPELEPGNIYDYLELSNSSYVMSSSKVITKDSKKMYEYVFSNFDTGYLSHDPLNDGKNVKSANLEIRKQNMEKRTSLPIDNIEATKAISNTDQLWWAVEHGYKPTFNDNNSVAAKCYQKARQICLDNIGSNYTEIDKVRSLFEYMTSNMKYNNWVIKIDKNNDWKKYSDYFLEGPLLNNVGVCDGFSKMLVLLGGIEQINTLDSQRLIRCGGYDKRSGAGHAWNYYSPDGNKYYLVCPTWGQSINEGISEYLGYQAITTDYLAFMSSKDYFYYASNGKYEFIDHYWESVASKKSDTVYSKPTGYDSLNLTELNALKQQCSSISGGCILSLSAQKLNDYSNICSVFSNDYVSNASKLFYDSPYIVNVVIK